MICGEGVGLRLVLEEDLSLLARWRDDDLTRVMFYSTCLLSESGLRSWFKSVLSDPARMRFMINRLQDGETIGIIGLEHIDHRNQTAELAGLLIDPSARRQAWATKSVQTMIRYAFDDLNLHRLSARIPKSNHMAQQLAEKAGLRNEGIARQAVFRDGAYEDVVHLAILREEWQNECSATSAH